MLELENSSTNWINEYRAQQGEELVSGALPRVRLQAGESCIVKNVSIDTPRGKNQETLTADIGDGVDAINFLLVAASLPEKSRSFVDYLVGLAGDRTEWFEANDLQVGMRARVGDVEMSRAAACKWVQRRRKELTEWQDQHNLALIECSPGGQDADGKRYPSRYKVNLLALAAATVEEARGGSQWKRDPSRALELAAQKIIEDTPQTPAYKPRFRAPRRDDEAVLIRNPKTAATLMCNAAGILHARGEDVGAWLEQHIRELREAVGSVHTKAKEQWTDTSIAESQGGGDPVADLSPLSEVEQATADACTALDAFSSVGASKFLVTMKDESTGTDESKKNVTLRELALTMPVYVERNNQAEESLIVRPTGAALIQIDECAERECELLANQAFLVAETSPANYQVWLALPSATSDDERKQVRERLIRGALAGGAANVGAGGAMRFPGSRNCKAERRQPDGSFPRVRLSAVNYGRVVTTAELERAGLLAEPLPPCDSSALQTSRQLRPMDIGVHRSTPDYEKCLRSVKCKPNGKPDRSDADLLFAVTCFDWKHGFDETVALLKRVSQKARARRDDYAERTARLAWSKVAEVAT